MGNISKIIAILMVAGSMSWTEKASLEASTLIKKKKKNPKKNRAQKAKGRKTKKKSFKENKKRFNRGSFKKETDGIGGGSLTGGVAVLSEQKQEPEDKKTSENSKNPNTLDQESVFAGGNDPSQSGIPKSHIEAPQTGLLVVKKLNNPAISTPGQEGNRGGALSRSNLSADLSYDISADEGQFSGNTNHFHQKDLEKIVKYSEYDSTSEEPSDFDNLNISKIGTLVEENLNSPEIGAPVQKAGGGEPCFK